MKRLENFSKRTGSFLTGCVSDWSPSVLLNDLSNKERILEAHKCSPDLLPRLPTASTSAALLFQFTNQRPN